MVVFTCNHCGDSLQKPKVEKHYLTVCRRRKSLTCVDCLKDFGDDEFSTHIKCVTEEERYAAKGSVLISAAKKGEIKQESWTEMIKSIIENVSASSVHRGQKNILEIIGNSVNVPRKRMKFINFIKSSLGGRVQQKDIEVVWDMIEEYKMAKQDSKKTNNDAEQSSNAESSTEKVCKNDQKRKFEDTKTLEEVINEPVETKKKKKKSKQTAEEDDKIEKKSKQSEIPMENGNARKEKEGGNLQEEIVEKQQNDKIHITCGTIGNGEANGSIDKVKQKKKKLISESTVDLSQQVEEGEPMDSHEKHLKQKKRKSKYLEQTETDKEIEQLALKQNEPSKKCKTDNKKVSEVEKDVCKSQDGNGENGKFSMQDKIIEIVRAKGNISLKKLEKKVAVAYLKQTGIEFSPKLSKKFNKKLRKSSELEIVDDTIRLLQ